MSAKYALIVLEKTYDLTKFVNDYANLFVRLHILLSLLLRLVKVCGKPEHDCFAKTQNR